MNWGGFAGGLAQGFNNGVNMGKTLDGLSKQRKLDDLRAKGIEEAKGLHESAIAGLIKETGVGPALAPAQGQLPAPGQAPTATGAPDVVTQDTRDVEPSRKVASVEVGQLPTAPQVAAQTGIDPAATGQQRRFMVGDREFNTREEAVAAARAKAPSVMDFMAKTLVPRMQEAYLAQGDVEKAEAWGQWAEQRQSKKAMSEWASAWRAASMGNIEKAADHVFNLYKTYDDGITPLSKEVVKDKDGNITGFNVKLKVEETGEERTQFIDQKSLTEMGLAALSPPQMFELQFKRQQAADQAAASQRAELAKEDRAEQRAIRTEDRGEARSNRAATRDQDNALERISITEQLRQSGATQKVQQEVGAKVGLLRQAGYSDEFINGALPTLLGIGEYRKGASPEEARRMLYQERLKDTYGFARRSPEEQRQIIERDMEVIYGNQTQTPASPAAGGLPQGRTPQQQGGGIPVYDPATNSIVYR